MSAGPAQPSDAVAETARSLAVDLVTAEVTSELRAAQVRCLLLKGPVIALWLYPRGTARTYVDTDLLVDSDDVGRAEEVLGRLGFAPRLEPQDTPGWQRPSREWLRAADDANVDLHRTLAGVGVEPAVMWRALTRDTEGIVVGGREIETLGVPARALHVALHAVQHGSGAPTPLEDLRRAIESLDATVWDAAAALAAEVAARGALAAGLRLLPQGAALAARLDLPEPSVEATLLATTPPPVAVALIHFGELPGAGARIRFIARKLVPTPRYMRAWSPLARRGPAGLVLAYLWRPLWLVRHTPAGFRAWHRARREVASRSSRSSMTHELGAYGLRLRGLDAAARWMVAQAADAPTLELVTSVATPDDAPSELDAQAANLSLIGGGRLRARRGEQRVSFSLPDPVTADELIHPYLAPAAALVWQWSGREALHGGVVALGGGAC